MTRRRLFRSLRWVWIGCLLTAFLAAGSVAAIQRSVTVQAHWRVLPYQVLQFVDTDDDASAAVYIIREPTARDWEKGSMEDEYAFRLRVVSNTSWKLQVTRPSAAQVAVEIRGHGSRYAPLTQDGLVVAAGANGSYEIGIDIRIPLGQDSVPVGEPLNLVFTLMSL